MLGGWTHPFPDTLRVRKEERPQWGAPARPWHEHAAHHEPNQPQAASDKNLAPPCGSLGMLSHMSAMPGAGQSSGWTAGVGSGPKVGAPEPWQETGNRSHQNTQPEHKPGVGGLLRWAKPPWSPQASAVTEGILEKASRGCFPPLPTQARWRKGQAEVSHTAWALSSLAKSLWPPPPPKRCQALLPGPGLQAPAGSAGPAPRLPSNHSQTHITGVLASGS